MKRQNAFFFGAPPLEEEEEEEAVPETRAVEDPLLAAFEGLAGAEVRVVDTILFANGCPKLWIFSDKNGRVRRRHRRRLNWLEIHERLQRLGRRERRRGPPDEPIAVLRWKKGSETISTLLDWRQLRDLCRKIPKSAGPTLTSWEQFVCLQPYHPPRLGSASGVFSHRIDESSSRGSLVLPNQSREFMTWPGAAPRSKNDTRYPSSQLVRENTNVHTALSDCSKKVAIALQAASVTGFVAEFVFDKKQPMLVFLDDLSFSTKNEARQPEKTTRIATEASWWRRRRRRPEGHYASTSRVQRIRLATLARMVSVCDAPNTEGSCY